MTKKCTTLTTTDNSPSIKWNSYSNFCLIFEGSCLKKIATLTPPNRINFLITYELETWSRDLSFAFTVKDCLFEGVKLTKKC